MLLRRLTTTPARVLTIPAVIYVNSVTGSDSNNGLLPSTPKLTLSSAIAALPGGSGVLRITAPASTPIFGFITFSSGDITLEGLDHTPWYTERTTTWTSGWTDLGDGIYRRSDGGGDADIMFVPTQFDSDGFGRLLIKNTVTPTTPAAGQFGRTGGFFYVHLIDDETPNSHTLKRHNTGFLYRASGTARVTIRDCVARYSGGNGIFECNSASASMILKDCIGQYSASAGVSLPVSGAGIVYCVRCTMQRHSNDGFNQHGGTLYLDHCDASYNNDEGVGNHNGRAITIRGGRYHHNQSAGVSCVNSGSEMYLSDVLVDFNGAKNQPGIERNGIVFDTGSSGSVLDCVSRNNVGSGFYCNGATVAITNLLSGLEQGNTLADDLC